MFITMEKNREEYISMTKEIINDYIRDNQYKKSI